VTVGCLGRAVVAKSTSQFRRGQGLIRVSKCLCRVIDGVMWLIRLEMWEFRGIVMK